jgi:hypothetical protein
MSGVIAWYLICTIAAWRIYFSNCSRHKFRSRLRWTFAFSVLPFLFLLAAMLILILKDVNAFFSNL